MSPDRRWFLGRAAGLAGAFAVAGLASACGDEGARDDAATRADPRIRRRPFEISLAQWSLHRTIRAGELDPLDFAAHAVERYGVDAVEHVNQFYTGRGRDTSYLNELRRRAEHAGVRSLLIMCDGEGMLGDPDEAARVRAVENHRPWVEAADLLGCHSIRVNAESRGERDEQRRLCADGLRRLCEVADPHGIDVLVENHGGLSSDAGWLVDVMRDVDHPRIGTLPDFGNFTVQGDERYDAYRGVRELMPYARAVSAKSFEFDAAGNETTIDYARMMRIVTEAGYAGYVGVEYEGPRLSEEDGIRATIALLERVREELAAG